MEATNLSVYDQASAFGVDTAHLAEYDCVQLAYGQDSKLSKASSNLRVVAGPL